MDNGPSRPDGGDDMGEGESGEEEDDEDDVASGHGAAGLQNNES